ncbi:cyclic nucleotide-binding/CBS domain-containing protein [Leisingera sp.]|uniref:CBS domain-containing protein n=1 Tax=Leisingera sp. TaxID=1879318 RepID=UPI002B26C69C|nr:CBS domain-containing protein [Leisingera sp.]
MTIRRLFEELETDIEWIAPVSPVDVALALLAQDGTSALLVSPDKRSMAGILTGSDIVRYLEANKKLPGNLRVQNIMTHPVISCDAHQPVQRLEWLMSKHNVRHIPVTEDGVPVAVVGILDVTRYRLLTVEQEAEELREYVAGAPWRGKTNPRRQS